MNKSNLITEKIDELIKLAEIEGEPNVQIVLLALNGSRFSSFDGMLAAKIQEYQKDVLIPLVRQKMRDEYASRN